ncbi:MAG: DUF3347 domain-containing protein, partial [Planctomycetes bacterium]|nr:DUF3347 domain-containing protein [Planctomycetota bacterium]
KPTYEGRMVTLGPRAGDFYLIKSGVQEGEEVVVHGAFRIDSAMQIAAKPSMMGQRGGEVEPPHDRSDIPEPFIFGLKPVYSAYLALQESLADDDVDAARQAGADLTAALGLVDTTGLIGEPLGAWRRLEARLKLDAATLDLETLRVRFEGLSRTIIDLERRFGHHGTQTWYLAFCPMALDDKGAHWMQRGSEIDNPYFGAAMLRCGEIQSEFPPLEQDLGDRSTSRPAASPASGEGGRR